MSHKRFFAAALTLAALLTLFCVTALAGEVDCDAVYCFTAADFSQEEQDLRGICITSLPEPSAGTVLLGNRVLQPGDILTAEQVSRMTFSPLRRETDATATVSYLPIYDGRVESGHTMTISIRGKEDKAPVAQDSALETYKNIPNQGKLAVEDPEGQSMTFTLVRQPKRGTVELKEDGTFVYTPKKNKVGVDSFVYTAADPQGNVSRQATVTVQILKPTDSKPYTDTVGKDCRFAAEWMRNTGLFVGEQVGKSNCFCPETTVTRGQFMAMLSEVLDIPTDEKSLSAISEDTPAWLRPYAAAALRSGLLTGLPEGSVDAPVTGGEAAVMLQNALDLTVSTQTLEEIRETDAEPTFATASLIALREAGVELQEDAVLTRADAAKLLYQVSHLAITAPGTAVFRLQ